MAKRPWSSTGNHAGSRRLIRGSFSTSGPAGGLGAQGGQHLFDLRAPIFCPPQYPVASRRPVPRSVQLGQEVVVQLVDVGALEEPFRVVLGRLQQVGVLAGEEARIGQEPGHGARPAAVHAEYDDSCGGCRLIVRAH